MGGMNRFIRSNFRDEQTSRAVHRSKNVETESAIVTTTNSLRLIIYSMYDIIPYLAGNNATKNVSISSSTPFSQLQPLL